MSGSLPQNKVDVPSNVDEEEFFTLEDGVPTLATRADLEDVVPNEEKDDLREIERYWVNKPFAFVVIYKNEAQQEYRYILVEPTLSGREKRLLRFISAQLKRTIDYEKIQPNASATMRGEIVRDETIRLLKRYNLIGDIDNVSRGGAIGRLQKWSVKALQKRAASQSGSGNLDPIPVDSHNGDGGRYQLEDSQVEKLIYYIIRDYINYGKIDGIKRDVNIEDISCNGYNRPVFIYHTRYNQMITNIRYGEEELDEFVIQMAQKAGKGISKRQPTTNTTLADGSRAQLTLGEEVTDEGSNFTIRQFKEIPFTPVDLVNWETFSLDQMVYLWLAIENGRSMIIAGGTASGKTTTLNALSMFIPSRNKIVSIEDTRELVIPQKNWIANSTRDSFTESSDSSIDEFELLTDALRHRPDYITMGEVRAEEGRTLFQAMNTGHTVATTFHAASPQEVVLRFTSEPINVSKSMFSSVDIILNQSSTKVDGDTVRRVTDQIEMRDYSKQDDSFSVDETFTWRSREDRIERKQQGMTALMDEIAQLNGWGEAEFWREWNQRKAVLAYLIKEDINSYAAVAATIQAFTASPGVILGLVGNNELRDRLGGLQNMETIDIDTTDEEEQMVPRPSTSPSLQERVEEIVEESQDLFSQYGDMGQVSTPIAPETGSETSGSRPAQVPEEADSDTDPDEFGVLFSEDDRGQDRGGAEQQVSAGSQPEASEHTAGSGQTDGAHQTDESPQEGSGKESSGGILDTLGIGGDGGEENREGSRDEPSEEQSAREQDSAPTDAEEADSPPLSEEFEPAQGGQGGQGGVGEGEAADTSPVAPTGPREDNTAESQRQGGREESGGSGGLEEFDLGVDVSDENGDNTSGDSENGGESDE